MTPENQNVPACGLAVAHCSPSVAKALRILADYKDEHDRPISPRIFARRMWPDSPGWLSPTKCGNNGTTRGGAMPQAGGGMMGKLERAGLIYGRSKKLTLKGQALLANTKSSRGTAQP